jgi:hypothetical protein
MPGLREWGVRLHVIGEGHRHFHCRSRAMFGVLGVLAEDQRVLIEPTPATGWPRLGARPYWRPPTETDRAGTGATALVGEWGPPERARCA